MSTRKGESTRKRAQKYQNTRAFKNDLHDKTVKIKQLNGLQISNVCERCKSILEWKIKYKKFKPLKAAATCTKCSEKSVKHAYHIMCKPCADKNGVCPKCGKQEELVPPQPTAEELMKLDQEMQAMLKTLPERKRRTFLRYVEKNSERKKKLKSGDSKDACSSKADDLKDLNADDDDTLKKGTQDLMAFLGRLKMSCKNDDEKSFFDDLDDFDDSDDFDDDSDDDDSNNEEENTDGIESENDENKKQ